MLGSTSTMTLRERPCNMANYATSQAAEMDPAPPPLENAGRRFGGQFALFWDTVPVPAAGGSASPEPARLGDCRGFLDLPGFVWAISVSLSPNTKKGQKVKLD